MTGIYVIVSKSNPERFYIGSSVDVRRRLNHHRNRLLNNAHHSIKLQNYVNKYGIDDLIFKPLIECERDKMILTEQNFIDELKPSFNISPTAGSRHGLKHSDETRRKIALSHIGIRPSEDTRKLLSEQRMGNKFHQGHTHTEAANQKNREKHLGKTWTEEHKRAQSERMKGDKNPAYGKNYKNV